MHSYCENCEHSKKELDETKKKLFEFQNLAKKIIQTDLLIQKYSDLETEQNKLKSDLSKKQKDYDHLHEQFISQTKEVESFKKLNKSLNEKRQEIESNNESLKQKLEISKQTEKTLNEEITSLKDRNFELKNESSNQLKEIEILSIKLKEANNKYDDLKKEFENLKLTLNKKSSEVKSIEITSTPLPKVASSITVPETLKTTQKEAESNNKDVSFFFSDDEEGEDENDIKEEEEESINKIEEIKANELESVQNVTDDQSKNVSISKLEFENNLDELKNEELNLNELEFSESISDSESNLSDNSSNSASSSSSSSTSSSSSSSSSLSTSKSSDKISISKLEENAINFGLSDDEENEPDESPNSNEKLKKEQEENETIEKERLEKELKEKELEIKINQVIEKVASDQIEELFNNVVEHSINEINITEFIIEKLINKEIEQDYKGIVNAVIKEEEKHQKDEIRSQIALEIIEKIVNDSVDNLIKECCERTLYQEITERNMKIYDELLDDLIPKMIEKELLNVIFEEMSGLPKLIVPCRPIKSPPPVETKASKNKTPIQESKAKRFKSEPEIQTKHSVKEIHKATQLTWEDSHTSYRDIRNNIKEYLAEYFRTYNFKNGFTFEDLDDIIEKMAKANNEDIDKAKFFTDLLLIHFINNKFFPLDEKRIKYYTTTEESIFKDYQSLIEKKNNETNSNEIFEIQKQIEVKKSKLDHILHVKITSEEEKYVYLVKKLKEHPNYENLVDDVLFELKTLLLTDDYNKLYNYRIARMIGFISKSTKNNQFLNSLVFDLISLKNKIMPSYFFTIIITLARIWPESFSYKEIETVQNPILCVIMYIIKSNIIKYSNPITTNYLLYSLETLCNWKFKFENSLQLWDYFQTVLTVDGYDHDDDIFILNDNEFKLIPIMFEYIQAFKLLCINEGWDWTINVFLKEFVYKSLEQHTETSSSTDLELKMRSQRFLAFYLYTQAYTLSFMCPKKDAISKSTDAIKSYSLILHKLMFQPSNLNTKETFIIECVILESLVLLSPLNPTESFLQIQMWLLKYKSLSSDRKFLLPSSLEYKIKYNYELFKEKLPSHIVIAF